MSECPSCAAADANPRHPGFHSGCEECSVRAIAQGPQHFEAQTVKRMIPAYTAELRRLFGDDVKAREAGHQRVKKWAARIEGAKP